MQHASSGFVAGCEAVAPLRRSGAFTFGAAPLDLFLIHKSKGKARAKGIAQEYF